MHQVMLRYPLLIDGEFQNMFFRENWKTNQESGYISFGNDPTNDHGYPQNDVIRVPKHNVLGWVEIESED